MDSVDGVGQGPRASLQYDDTAHTTHLDFLDSNRSETSTHYYTTAA